MGELSRAERNIEWIETHCRIPEGRFVGQPVKLRPWQRDVIREIYDSPTRTAIISFGRKNAKTTLSAFLCLLHLVGPEYRRNGQLYSAAQSRDQAAILFELAAKVVRQSPDLSAHVGIRDAKKELYCHELGTEFKALSAEHTTAFGRSPFFVVHDELGQVNGPRSMLYEALETAAGAQEEPLSIVISTQAPTDADLFSVLIDDALTGADPEIKICLYTSDPDSDPFDVETIKQANPAFGDFLNAKEVMRQAEGAKRMPAREAAYRNLVLNQRITQDNPFIAPSVWKANGGAPDPRAFQENAVCMGVDLSRRVDLTAFVLVAKDADGISHVRADFFAPEDGVADRSIADRVPYDLWADQGYLHLTPGRTVDYEYVARYLSEIYDEMELFSVKFDRYYIDILKKELDRIGLVLPLEEHGQGYKDMTPAVSILEAELANERIRHGNHPILTWCASNAIVTSDPAGNRKLDKAKSTGRIDGMVALAMAMHSTQDVEEYVDGGLLAL